MNASWIYRANAGGKRHNGALNAYSAWQQGTSSGETTGEETTEETTEEPTPVESGGAGGGNDSGNTFGGSGGGCSQGFGAAALLVLIGLPFIRRRKKK